ncbi:MAG: TniB family NTP-binding protein [Methylicorpusculum sp.]|uniref:TniB family NTP-binding protein n=1 Tax=Methylicorpusculum sp. TaxID=2713644 RepID=UPI0027314DE9|nr:TniB family NTP-binding protein [Methylicorpusculum sp.]MDP2200835.1 TniB family NTP-binding protein [Methylicorpusculum sp.]
MIEYKHLHADVQAVMQKTDNDRIRFIDEPRWIGYGRAKLIMEQLELLLNVPKKTRMGNLLIIGDSNNGKTTLIERFYDLHGKSTIDEGGKSYKPIILIEAPPRTDEKALYIAILKKFFTTFRPTDSADKLLNQVLHLMGECQVKMLIIDELHSFLTGTAVKQRIVMNVLKHLSNQLKIPIIGVGTKDALMILHTDPQHASRFTVADLSHWKLDNQFASLLASFELFLPLKNPSLLKTKEMAQKIHSISEGNLGNVHELLKVCAKEAIKSGKEQIDAKIINDNQWITPTRGVRNLFN